jgi:peptidoglycan/xylan/chitin deacetylase (PgdA/CDA1 family)
VSLDSSRNERRSAARAVILMYHRIATRDSIWPDLCVTLSNFRAQMQVISETGCRVVRLRTLATAASESALPDRAVAITFDDGYADNVDAVSACLAEAEMAATFFIVGSVLDGPHEFWWDTVDRVFDPSRRLPPRYTLAEPAPPLTLPTITEGERRAARQVIVSRCYAAARVARECLIHDLLEWAGATGEPPVKRAMNPTEVKHLAFLPGMDIGAHSENHLWMPKQPVPIQSREAIGSRRRLEALLNRSVTCFAYPYGAYDAATAAVIEKAGFQLAVTTEDRPVRNLEPRFSLPRFQVPDCGSQPFADFLAKVLTS